MLLASGKSQRSPPLVGLVGVCVCVCVCVCVIVSFNSTLALPVRSASVAVLFVCCSASR